MTLSTRKTVLMLNAPGNAEDALQVRQLDLQRVGYQRFANRAADAGDLDAVSVAKVVHAGDRLVIQVQHPSTPCSTQIKPANAEIPQALELALEVDGDLAAESGKSKRSCGRSYALGSPCRNTHTVTSPIRPEGIVGCLLYCR